MSTTNLQKPSRQGLGEFATTLADKVYDGLTRAHSAAGFPVFEFGTPARLRV